MKIFVAVLLTVLVVTSVGYAVSKPFAPSATDPNNVPPPAGAILDLSGTPIPGGGNGTTFQTYTVNFVANITSTAITFAFREDPAFISFENASVVDLTTSSGNLLTNGDFTGGTHVDAATGNNAVPNGWIYTNMYGAAAGGVIDAPCPHAGGPTTNCWYDGAVQAYDAISQTITTVVGHNYRISFSISDDSSCSTNGGAPCNFSRLSTNGNTTGTGGNGIDVLAYAQAGLPAAGGGPTVPAPNSLVLIAIGLSLVCAWTYRRKLLGLFS